MSADGKKKRGESGRSKAMSSPFRLNGRPPDWQARALGCDRGGRAISGGSLTMRGMLGGVMAEALGFPMRGNFEQMIDHAQSRCTHPLLRIEEEEPTALAA